MKDFFLSQREDVKKSFHQNSSISTQENDLVMFSLLFEFTGVHGWKYERKYAYENYQEIFRQLEY